MSDQSEKLAKLKQMIQQSGFLSEAQKVIMLKNADEADEKEVEAALQFFEEEKEAWLRLKAESDEFLVAAKLFSQESLIRLKQKAKHLIEQKEATESKEENEEAEDLINNL